MAKQALKEQMTGIIESILMDDERFWGVHPVYGAQIRWDRVKVHMHARIDDAFRDACDEALIKENESFAARNQIEAMIGKRHKFMAQPIPMPVRRPPHTHKRGDQS